MANNLLNFFVFISDRQSKLNAENVNAERNASKRSPNLSGICIPSDTASNASHPVSAVSNDEGGFNEPSPDIKAKLKPAYTYEPLDIAALESAAAKDETDDDGENQHEPHTLHYVDFGYRLNPDGSESKHCFGEESELYADRRDNGLTEANLMKRTTNGFGAPKQSVVYATIKSDVPPPPPPIDFDTGSIKSDSDKHIDDNDEEDDDDDIDAKFEQIYHSPQNVDDCGNRPNINSSNDGIDNSEQLFETLANDQLPEASPLDIQDVEYADASDKEDMPDEMTSYEADRLLSSRYAYKWISYLNRLISINVCFVVVS